MNNDLRKARLDAGLTQIEVADRSNITETSYQRIEYGIQTPSLLTAFKIAKAVYSTVDKVFKNYVFTSTA